MSRCRDASVLPEIEAGYDGQDRNDDQDQCRAARTQKSALRNEAQHASGVEQARDQKDSRENGGGPEAVEVARYVHQKQTKPPEGHAIRGTTASRQHLAGAISP